MYRRFTFDSTKLICISKQVVSYGRKRWRRTLASEQFAIGPKTLGDAIDAPPPHWPAPITGGNLGLERARGTKVTSRPAG